MNNLLAMFTVTGSIAFALYIQCEEVYILGNILRIFNSFGGSINLV